MEKKELLRGLPKIDEVMRQESLVVLSEEKGDLLVTEAVRAVIADLRQSILELKDKEAGRFDASVLEIGSVAAAAAAKLAEDEELNLFPLINATGTILHTNLGRAPLCEDAVTNVSRVSAGYSDLEYNVPKGKRGSRHDLVGDLIAELTGAEDAMVVNNNAAATMIVLATLGAGKEIIVSRGELVEIGGAFRIPDIMMQSGAYLTEVGTSNKTKASDYENAIMTREDIEEGSWYDKDPRHGERFETGALMKVHKSNYDIVGFTEEAYKMAVQDTYPSWGWWIKNGHTTFIENWVLGTSVYSDNHIMFGDIAAWFYRWIGGIQPDPEMPGFKRVVLKPGFPEGLDSFSCSHDSPYGRIISGWTRSGGVITYRVTIPANSTGLLWLPGEDKPVEVPSGHHEFKIKS